MDTEGREQQRAVGDKWSGRRSGMERVGSPVAVCSLRAGGVACADASGARLAAGEGGGAGRGEVRAWRWRRGAGWAAAGAARAHRYGVTALRWAPGGALLASAGVDGAARLWAARGLAARGDLAAPHAAAARALCWATGERLLVGHDDGAVRVWRVRGAAPLACVRAHEGSVRALTAFGGAALLLAACTEGVLKIFNLNEVCNSGTEDSVVPAPLLWEDGAHELGALCADASSCGRAAATGGQDARVRLWTAPEAGPAGVGAGSEMRGGVLSGHSAGVTAVRWARGTALLVSASLDRTARVWAVRSRTCLRVLHAHSRYLTFVVVPQHARYIITGSNDKTIRTWSLSSFNIDDDLEPECSPLVHFGLGDLEGIGPVDDEVLLEGEESPEASAAVGGAACVWRARDSHAGAVNCVATHGDLLATASSDGMVRIFRWSEECGVLRLERTLEGHQYPALAVDFGAGGALLLSAGMDGRACLWDVQTGIELASLWAAGGAQGEGGGGVRGARASPLRAPLLLLVTDDGDAALWSIDGGGTGPVHAYARAAEACTCCAWAADARALAAGEAGGGLRVLAPPPAARALGRLPAAHDLGVLSCDFSPEVEETEESREYLLASGGMDEMVKLWVVTCDLGGDAVVKLGGTLAAHGGAVQSVRWGVKGMLATAGCDRWARVWRVSKEEQTGNVKGVQLVAVSAGGAGGSPTAAFLTPSLLAVGSLNGRLALWHLPDVSDTDPEEDEGVEPRWWREAGVVRWLTEYVTRAPGSLVTSEEEAKLIETVHERALCGTNLLDEPFENVLAYFTYNTNHDLSDDIENVEENAQENIETECGDSDGDIKDKEVKREIKTDIAVRLREELEWLRRPPLTYEEEMRVPHALRCTLSHAVPRWPVRASDGYTYDKAALAQWRWAVGDVSPVSGRRLRGAAPNHGVLRALRDLLAEDADTALVDFW